mmetsp:Transcript_9921/g.27698  ORF Transcript_9921/g.27698 Transcript_9921/m.27698 type:complete len:622 (-) Transcript_9921:371-2236(-)
MVRLILLLTYFHTTSGCTTVVIGKDGSVDGSPISSYNSDSGISDNRMAYIAPQDYEPGALRPVYPVPSGYPRYVGGRSPIYAPIEVDGAIQKPTEPLGHIPQVNHTYGYWESYFPIANENGVGFGESSCLGNIVVPGKDQGGEALFQIIGLMQVALERCATARCAIETMGYWAETAGFYGAGVGDAAASEAGEMLTVVDNAEAWVFHLMSDLHGGAVWAAQRVPDDHAAVCANSFIIRSVDFEDHERVNFMWSDGILDTARELVSAGVGPDSCLEAASFDFLRCFGADLRYVYYDKGYGPKVPDPLYSTLRMWRVGNVLSPGSGRPLTENVFDLPFSFRLDSPVTVEQVMDLHRDKLESTPYDLTKGPMSGPYGDPNRNEGGSGLIRGNATWPRAISIIRTCYSTVIHAKRDHSKVVWVSMHQPTTSIYVPFFLRSSTCHESYQRGDQLHYDQQSAWWVFSFVSNWMRLNWESMSQTFVFPKRRQLQAEVLASTWEITHNHNEAQVSIQGAIVEQWRELGQFLVMAYNDGFKNFPLIASGDAGYPLSWLESLVVPSCPAPKTAPSAAIESTTIFGSRDFVGVVSVAACVGFLVGACMTGVIGFVVFTATRPTSDFYDELDC